MKASTPRLAASDEACVCGHPLSEHHCDDQGRLVRATVRKRVVCVGFYALEDYEQARRAARHQAAAITAAKAVAAEKRKATERRRKAKRAKKNKEKRPSAF